MHWNVDELKSKQKKLEKLLNNSLLPHEYLNIKQDIESLNKLIAYADNDSPKIKYGSSLIVTDNYDKNLLFLKNESANISKDMSSILKIRKVPYKFFNNKKLSNDNYYFLVTDFLKKYDEDIYEFYEKLQLEKRIELNRRKYKDSNSKGRTVPIINDGFCYISTRFNKRLDSASTLLHEVIHAYQLDGIKNLTLLQNKMTSLFGETYAIFIEYVFCDYLKETKYNKYGLGLEGNRMDNLLIVINHLHNPLNELKLSKYNNGKFYAQSGIYTARQFRILLSELLAIYFYNIYLLDKDEAFRAINEFDSLLGTLPDEMILEKYDFKEIIKGNNKVLTKYLVSYNKE